MKRTRVLVVEDEPTTHETIRLYLERDGFEVNSAWDGAAALEKLRAGRYELVVLDLMLPSIDGLDICRALRRESETPVIMLTARSTEEDKLRGLSIGADDYVTKPFSPRELVARVRAVLRRTASEVREELSFERLHMNMARREVTLAGEAVRLTPTEFRLLACFLRAPRRTFTREELLRAALGDSEALDRTIDAHVMNLRRKIDPQRIETVFGVGYKLA